MKIINKQKFIAELGRLLTFMQEEDRLETLALYDKLFDSAVNEQALLQFLVSPTRQAVVLARAYQSDKSKLRPTAQSGEVSDSGSSHTLAFETVRRDAVLAGIIPDSDAVNAEETAPAEPTASDDVSTEGTDSDTAPIADAVEDSVKPEDENSSSESAEAPVGSDSGENAPAAEAPETEDADAEEGSADAPAGDNGSVNDAVDNFLASFTIAGDELNKSQPENADSSSAKADAPLNADPVADDFSAPLEAAAAKRRLNPLLLILYLIPAIPVGAAVTLLLLLPTVLFFSLAVCTVTVGALLLATAFGGFAMLSDILVVLGMALMVLAVGILSAWLFVWFIGGAIVGFIRWLCRLGRRLCSKEVAA